MEAAKKAIGCYSKLKHEFHANKPLIPLTDNGPDVEIWNQYLEYQKTLLPDDANPKWTVCPWLFVECYLYRRVQEAMLISPPISYFDVFSELKNENLFRSQEAIIALCIHLHDLKKNLGSLNPEQRQEEFYRFLQVSLWANKCDLSIFWDEESHQKSSILDALDSLKRYIVVNDMEPMCATLMSKQIVGAAKMAKARVDIVLDNAGYELITDFVLADAILTLEMATEVHFHGKSFPWFVSDATKNDFDFAIQQTVGSHHKGISKCGQAWKKYLKKGTWVYHDNMFWTLPHEFWRMEEVAPDLYAELKKSDLILFKGDLNFRKLVGDRKWEFCTPFGQALKRFRPAPLCSIRTLKSDVQVGFEPRVEERLNRLEPDWMVIGKFGAIQFISF
ncbi:damage-control phosphatase ARMT1 isoform X2 [Pyxicephalus adspersus]